MNIPSRHHNWLIVIILIVALSACTTQNSSTTPSPTTSNQPTPNPTTSNQPTPSPAPPTQTLATFCTDMKAGNNAAAETQFTPQGWLQFQPPGPPRKAYSSCTYDQVTILTDQTAQGHLVVTTVGNNQLYGIDVTFLLEGNSWKINSWVSHKQSADAQLQSHIG